MLWPPTKRWWSATTGEGNYRGSATKSPTDSKSRFSFSATGGTVHAGSHDQSEIGDKINGGPVNHRDEVENLQ